MAGVEEAGRRRRVLPAHPHCLCARGAASDERVLAVGASTLIAGVLLFACWISRIGGGTFLLLALGAGFSPLFVLVVLCMAGLISIVPLTAGGGVATIGATAGVLLALGVSRDVAINFSLASGLLVTAAALTAALIGLSASLTLGITGGRKNAEVRPA